MYLFAKYLAYFHIPLLSSSLFSLLYFSGGAEKGRGGSKGKNAVLETLLMKERSREVRRIRETKRKMEIREEKKEEQGGYGGKIRAMFIICFRKNSFYD